MPSHPIEWSPQFIFALVYNVIPATAIAPFLWLYILHNLPAGIAGLGTLLNPVFGVLFAAIQLQEYPSFVELSGIVLIIVALTLNTASAIKK